MVAAEPPAERTASHKHVPHLSVAQFAALKSAEKKVFRRVLIQCICLMVVNYLDRTNLSFASVQLNTDLGFDEQIYGLGAGLFFATYASMQVPANIMMTKLGGPIWLGSIGTAWGIVAACFCLMKGVTSFMVLRLLLGLFEAGALPGMWALLAQFYSKERVTMPLGWLMGALIVSQALGAPVAALLMMLDGHGGLRGWQWLFLVEGIVAVLVSVSFFWMPKDIDALKSLTAEEREALHASMMHHAKPVKDVKKLLGAIKNPAVWIAGTGIKFLRDIAFYGLMYWLPLIIKSLLPHDINAKQKQLYSILLTAVPFACSAGMQFFTCWHSQRKNERRFHLATCWGFGVLCLALLPLTEMKGVHQASFVLLILGVVGVFGVEGISVSYYLALMGGEKNVGVALINTIGALGGFVGPYLIGSFTKSTGNYYAALWLLAGCLAVAAINAALVSEEWAAKFSLKGHHTHGTGSVTRQHSRLASFPVGDASLLTGIGTLMDSDSESCCDGSSGAPPATKPHRDLESQG